MPGLWGEFLLEDFYSRLSIFITCVSWVGRLADVPAFGRVEWEETTWMKVKVLSFLTVLLFGIYVSA